MGWNGVQAAVGDTESAKHELGKGKIIALRYIHQLNQFNWSPPLELATIDIALLS
jgi:hypothetical protein